MLRILHDTKYDFIKYWKVAVLATVAFIVLGIGLMGYHKARTGNAINQSIEFTGGSVVQLEFAKPAHADVVRSSVHQAGFADAEVTQFGQPNEYLVKVRPQSTVVSAANADSAGASIVNALKSAAPDNPAKVVRAESVGPRVGDELKTKAFTAILISFVVTLIYLAIRFEWRFGVAAVIATAHDLLTTIAFLAMMHLEVSLTVVAALLTVIGYSLNDTIIIFDRVRENLKKQRKESLREVLNRSINETLPRSIMTHATVLAATLSLLVFAGEVIRPFSWIMAFGVFTGTFSSIYIAGPILLWIEHKWPRETGTEKKGTARALAEERKRERPTPVATR
ncbi:MAG TPA: protein translocase subunit SecF [Gemmatimonadaceae bacterium]